MRGQRAFTLVELVVTVGIIAAIAAVAASVMRGARDQARVAECASNLRQFGVLLHGYAQDNYSCLPEGSTNPDRLPPATADLFRTMLDSRIDALYCRTFPERDGRRREWQTAIADETPLYEPSIGYIYVAGSEYPNWDVPNEKLPESFAGARITSAGHGIRYDGNAVWMADFARCTGGDKKTRSKPHCWDLTSHPAQLVEIEPARSDFQLPDGANVLFEDGRVIFRSFDKLRPRVLCNRRIYFW
ncbi:MAG: type II secretion system protein [Verrucomicrobia bacterium]|nr:type II secretion system protein [Verrucomicrobiota bacterium]